MLDDLSYAPYVFFGSFFGALAINTMIENSSSIPFDCPGFKVNKETLAHASACPLNMCFGAARQHDLSRVTYSPFQLFRISFGVMFSNLFLIAGWIGSKSGILAGHPQLETFAWNTIFYTGALFLFLHSQMTWERLHNGNQIADAKAFVACCSTRFIIARYTYLWHNRVLQEVADAEALMNSMNGFIMIWSIRIALCLFLLIDILRLSIILPMGQEAWFTPSQKVVTVNKNLKKLKD